MSFPRYPAYRASGVEWLGEVPAHWEVRRGRWLYQKAERLPEEGDGVVTAFRDGQVTLRENRRMDGFTIAVLEVGYQRVLKGDLVVNGMDAFAGAIGVSDSAGKCSPEYSVLTAARPGISNEYFANALRVMAERNYVYVICPSVRERAPRFRFESFKEVLLPLPPASEQQGIAAFLDRETARIDALVAEQERLIELLKEKRQAVISDAVTKGLDPAAPMRDSGIEWVGQVPSHWTVCRLKTVTEFLTSGPRGWSERVGEAGALFIQSGDLNDSLGVDFETANRVAVQDDAESARTKLQEGDVVVCITGAKTGNVAVCSSVPEPAYVNQHVCLVRPQSSVLPAFLAVQLKSSLGQTHFELSQYGLKEGLSLQDVTDAPVLVPPMNEQAQLAAVVAAHTAKLNGLLAAAGDVIRLLEERRSCLISAAVTGQIDVRPESMRHVA